MGALTNTLKDNVKVPGTDSKEVKDLKARIAELEAENAKLKKKK